MSEPDSASNDPPITKVLRRLAVGEEGAADDLLPLVYDELRGLAQSRLARLRAGQTLQATALVHEAWLRLGGRDAVQWDGRAHFFGAAANAMRLIVIDHARRKSAAKRGAGRPGHPPGVEIAASEPEQEVDVEALDQALTELEREYPRPARLVVLRYFGGLGMEEIAAQLGVSLRTAERDWMFARSWLRRDLANRGVRDA